MTFVRSLLATAQNLTALFLSSSGGFKVVAITGVLLVAGFGTALFFIAPEAEEDVQTSAVAARSTGGRLLLGLEDIAVGSTQSMKGSETTEWAGLHRAEGRADVNPDTLTALGSGPVHIEPINEVRFKLRSAGYIKDGILHELILPHDTIRMRIPGEAGRPGDTLILTFDLGRSISDEDGLLYFRPTVTEAQWTPPPDEDEAPAPDPNGNHTSDPVTPQIWEYDDPAPSGDTAAGDRTAGPTQQAAVGRMSVYVHDELELLVETLNASFAKVGVTDASGNLQTYFDGARTIDLRAYEGPDDAAHLVTFQLPAGQYQELHLGFTGADARIDSHQSDLFVPLPHLVLERPFEIAAGERFEFVLDFSIPRSLFASGEGAEFRPLVWDLRASDMDPDAVEAERSKPGHVHEPPSQYLTGGTVFPSIGQTNAGYVQILTGRDADETRRHAGDAVIGGEQRPVESQGDLADPDDLTTHPDDVLQNPGANIVTANGQQIYILESLSRNMMPSAKTLAPLGAQEVSRLDNLPVMVVQGPTGLEADLRALPGVIHVSRDVALEPFP